MLISRSGPLHDGGSNNNSDLVKLIIGNESKDTKIKLVKAHLQKNKIPVTRVRKYRNSAAFDTQRDHTTIVPLNREGLDDLRGAQGFNALWMRSGARLLTAIPADQKVVDSNAPFLRMDYFPDDLRMLLGHDTLHYFAEAAIYSILGLTADYDRVVSLAKADGIEVIVEPTTANIFSTLFNTSENAAAHNVAKSCADYLRSNFLHSVGKVRPLYVKSPEFTVLRQDLQLLEKRIADVYDSSSLPNEYVVANLSDCVAENFRRKGRRVAVVDQPWDVELINFNPGLSAGQVSSVFRQAADRGDYIGSTDFPINARRVADTIHKRYFEDPENALVYIPGFDERQSQGDGLIDLAAKTLNKSRELLAKLTRGQLLDMTEQLFSDDDHGVRKLTTLFEPSQLKLAFDSGTMISRTRAWAFQE
jgi:hypothetical protein